MSSPIENALSEMKSRSYTANKERYETGQAMKKMNKTATPEESEATAPLSFNELVEKNSQALSESLNKKRKMAKQNKSSGFAAPYSAGADIGAGSGE